MALITVEGVSVLDNPSRFSNPFQFEITFSCNPPGIPGELEWKLIYVGSADNETFDQELDSVLVGPIAVGRNKFVFQAPGPDPTRVPEKDLLEVTVILLTCSYLEQEFIRVGYYVNNDYGPNIMLMEEYNAAKQAGTPMGVHIGELHRHILADKPRVTRFQIHWTEEELKAAKAQQALEGTHPHSIENLNSAPSDYSGGVGVRGGEGMEGVGETMDDDDMEEEDLDEEDSEDDEGDGSDVDDELEDDDKENMVQMQDAASSPGTGLKSGKNEVQYPAFGQPIDNKAVSGMSDSPVKAFGQM